MESPRHRADGQGPAPPAATVAADLVPTESHDRPAAPPPARTARPSPLERSNAALAEALAAFQRGFDPPASR